MKEKLIKLLKACINDEDYLMKKDNSIRIELSNYSSHYISKYNEYYLYAKYYSTYNKEQFSLYSFRFNFDNEPSIIIKPELYVAERKTVSVSIPFLKIKIKDLFHGIFTNTFEVSTRKYNYILSCGELKYEIDDNTVNELVQMIDENRKKFRLEQEQRELDERFKKYRIID